MRDRLIELIKNAPRNTRAFYDQFADYLLENGVIVLPCKIGDEAWIIRNYKGVPTPQKGIVSSISFTDDMELAIAVKHIGRGRWGVNIFHTYKEAEKALRKEDEGK